LNYPQKKTVAQRKANEVSIPRYLKPISGEYTTKGPQAFHTPSTATARKKETFAKASANNPDLLQPKLAHNQVVVREAPNSPEDPYPRCHIPTHLASQQNSVHTEKVTTGYKRIE